jgi:hypothetical protein
MSALRFEQERERTFMCWPLGWRGCSTGMRLWRLN